MAKDTYCWRCDKVIPMLTDQEWAIMEPALTQAIADVQTYRTAQNVSLGEAMTHGLGKTALAVYQELTGFAETNPDAIWHHRISIYGPPCHSCGKPLRTPQATFCAACGTQA